jgi:hypothetical protein
MNEQPLWSIPIQAADVTEDGRDVVRTADEPTRAAIARLAQVNGIPRLELRAYVRRQGAEGLHIAGTVSATVEQTCVVTLEPLANEINETIDLSFDPAAKDLPLTGEDDPALAEAPEPPEPLIDGTVDLGALAVDFLVLAIDPYPRKPGANFSPPQQPPGDDGHPFAALAKLKGPRSGEN